MVGSITVSFLCGNQDFARVGRYRAMSASSTLISPAAAAALLSRPDQCRHQAALGKLSGSAADAAASKAAAAVAEVAAAAGGGEEASNSALPAPQQKLEQQQQQDEELGGATATANAVDVSNITDFIAVGAGENQLNNRALRNLLLLHLKKVNVAELPELPVHEGPASLPGGMIAAGAGSGGRASGGLQGGSPGGAPQLWSDVALLQQRREGMQRQQQQQQQQRPQVNGIGPGGDLHGPAAGTAAGPGMFAGPGAEASAPAIGAADAAAAAAAAAALAEKPAKKRIRFADD